MADGTQFRDCLLDEGGLAHATVAHDVCAALSDVAEEPVQLCVSADKIFRVDNAAGIGLQRLDIGQGPTHWESVQQNRCTTTLPYNPFVCNVSVVQAVGST